MHVPPLKKKLAGNDVFAIGFQHLLQGSGKDGAEGMETVALI